MEARVNSEMLIYHCKTSSWVFYETLTKDYKHWMTGTVGLAAQTIPTVYLVIDNQHRTAERSHPNAARSPQCCRSVGSGRMKGMPSPIRVF